MSGKNGHKRRLFEPEAPQGRARTAAGGGKRRPFDSEMGLAAKDHLNEPAAP